MPGSVPGMPGSPCQTPGSLRVEDGSVLVCRGPLSEALPFPAVGAITAMSGSMVTASTSPRRWPRQSGSGTVCSAGVSLYAWVLVLRGLQTVVSLFRGARILGSLFGGSWTHGYLLGAGFGGPVLRFREREIVGLGGS